MEGERVTGSGKMTEDLSTSSHALGVSSGVTTSAQQKCTLASSVSSISASLWLQCPAGLLLWSLVYRSLSQANREPPHFGSPRASLQPDQSTPLSHGDVSRLSCSYNE